MADKVVFNGSFPPIGSAIKVSGNGDGMRIMIDIPESEMAAALNLMLFRQVPIKVTIEPYEQEKPKASENGTGTAGDRTPKRRAAKQRVR